jgi:myo-inositol-1(or 4)-monophosphatase
VTRDTAEALALAEQAAHAIRLAVLPHLGQRAARVATGRAPGGDVTMHVDEVAEAALEALLRDAGSVAAYTEDRGYFEIGRPDTLLVVDPIDGTRPAAAGFEAACVSIGVFAPDRDATLGDVAAGVVLELQSGRCITARRGGGTHVDGAPVRCVPMEAGLDALFWGASQRGRPSLPVAVVLEELIDGSAMRGGYFDLGSAAFTMTRLVTGQLDAYVDPGARMLDELPHLEDAFRQVGAGARCTNFPYDIAAALLAVEEAGGQVCAADGSSLAGRGAVGSGEGFEVSVVAAVDSNLSDTIVAALDRGMTRLRSRFPSPDGD